MAVKKTPHKKSGPKPKAAAPPIHPAARPIKRTLRKKSDRLGQSLLPGVTPEIPPPPPRQPKVVKAEKGTHSIKRLNLSDEQISNFGFEVSIDPAMFQKVKKSTGHIPLPVGFAPQVYNSITRYNPRRGGISIFANQSVARWLRDNLDQVLLASLDASASKGNGVRTSVLSLEPDIAMRLKAATTVLKGRGFAKATISSLILGCVLLQAKDLKLV